MMKIFRFCKYQNTFLNDYIYVNSEGFIKNDRPPNRPD